MDQTEDLSARVLLRDILSTVPPRTPITRSATKTTSATRRSSRFLSKKNAAAQTPQAILRRSLKHKLSESTKQKSQLAPGRRSTSIVGRMVPVSTSMLFDDGDTPRQILKNILQTEPVKSPLVHKKGPSEEHGPSSSTTRKPPGVELSALDLPDATITGRLSRKRPRRSLNANALGKRLQGADDSPKRSEDSQEDLSSLSLLSTSSVRLQTPFADAESEKRDLRRKVPMSQKVLVGQFGAPVNKQQTGDSPKRSEDSQEDLSSLSLLSTSSVRLQTPFADAESEKRDLRRKVPMSQKVLVGQFGAAVNKQQAGDSQEKSEDSQEDLSSLSSLSTSSVRLQTPFFNAESEKRDLRRKVPTRPKVLVGQFGAPVNKQQAGGISSDLLEERDPSETHYSEGFTLGLTKLSEADVTMDIVNCNTALYAQSDATNSNFSITATQDKPSVMGSLLQRILESGLIDVEHSGHKENAPGFLFQSNDGGAAAPGNGQQVSCSLESIDEAQEDKDEKAGVCRPEDADILPSELEERALESQTEFGDNANQVETQTEHDSNDDAEPEDDIGAGSKSEEENVPDAQTDEEAAETQTDEVGADPECQGDVKTGSESESDQDLAESQTEEEAAVDSQPQEDGETGEDEEGEVEQQSEEEPDALGQEDAEDEDGPECQTEGEEDEAEHQTEEEAQSVAQSEDDVEAASQSEEVDIVESQNEDENDGEREDHKHPDHISRRSHRSEGALILPLRDAGEDVINTTAEGVSEADSEAYRMIDVPSNQNLEELASSMSHLLKPKSVSGPDEALGVENTCHANEESSFHQDEASEHPSNNSADEAAPQGANEQEEEWDEDGENEEFPSKTPAFVRQKRIFFLPKPSASTPVLTNSQASASQSNEALPAAKSKQVRQRKKPAEKKAALPKSYLMGVFKHFAKTSVAANVYPFLNEVMDVFFDRVALDLEVFAAHAKRKTIEVEDVVLLLKRQGYVTDEVPVEVLIEKYLRMEQRKLLIPIATSGNVVIPKERR